VVVKPDEDRRPVALEPGAATSGTTASAGHRKRGHADLGDSPALPAASIAWTR
jgi:hypothetical protein